MKRKVLLSVLLFMALCLAVPAVNAADLSLNVESGNNYNANLGTITDNQVSLTLVFDGSKFGQGGVIQWKDSITNTYSPLSGNPISITLPVDSSSVTVYTRMRYTSYYNFIESSLTISYNYVEPTPEPTIQPTLPYITASVYNTGANNAYYDYNVQCLPGEGYFFAPLSFYSYGGQLPQCDLTSAQTLIQVRVYAGEDIPIYSCALSGSGGVPNFQYIQTVLAAPVASSDVITGETVREELESIPNPVKASSGIVSGSWQALAIKKNVSSINTPFSEIISNSYHYFTFPNMTSPDIIKASLLNGTGNITLPLYNAVDGFTSLALLLPNYVSGVLTGLINPIAETVETIKDVILTTSDYVQDAMQALYAILPFIYLFIPDFVWWGFTIYLSYLVFAWILTLLCGYDVISTYYVDPFVSWVKSRRGGE